jgi:hypothetical protein
MDNLLRFMYFWILPYRWTTTRLKIVAPSSRKTPTFRHKPEMKNLHILSSESSRAYTKKLIGVNVWHRPRVDQCV